MKAAIISVGTELLFGQIVNTNTVYLSQKLNNLGIDVMYHYTVGDNAGRLKEILELAFKDCEIVLTTGGLGPTQDDLTKEIVCDYLNEPLVLYDDVMQSLYDYELFRNVPLTPNNFKQAYFPANAVLFKNERGTAPGFAVNKNDKIALCLPGPPSEMTGMFENYAQQYLEKFTDGVLYYRQIKTFGLYESNMETILLPLIDNQTDPTIATYASLGEVSLRIASKRATKEEAAKEVDIMTDKVTELIGEYIYSYEGESLPYVVGRKLIENNISLSSAESLTGGMFAQTVTDIPGISAIFERGIVTYTNRAKIEELGVREETLQKYSAVSEETAREMALGLKKVSGSDICVSATGIAGPSGGTEEKPVGLVYMGIAYKDKVEVRKIIESRKNRNIIRQVAVLNMFDMINKIISCI